MSDLIQTLEGATEGSRELDALVICATLAPEGSYVEQSPYNSAWCIYAGVDSRGQPRLWEKRGKDYRADGWPVTTSLDAALALVERMLPGVWFVIARGKTRATEPLHGARLLFGSDQIISEAEHEDLAISLCIALLRALHPEEGKSHG